MIKLNLVLAKLKQLIKTPKFLLIVFLVLIIILLLFLKKAVIKKQTPTPAALPTLPTISVPETKKDIFNLYTVQNIQFLGTKPELPNQLAIYQAKEIPKIEAFCQEIAQKLNLQKVSLPEKVKDKLLAWQIPETYLNCDLEKNLVYIYKSQLEGEKPNLEKAKQEAITYTQKIGLDLNQFSLKSENITYLKSGGGEFVKTTYQEATVIEFNYQKLLDSYLVHQKESQFYPLTISVGKNNQVIKLNYFLLPSQLQKTQAYPLLSIEEAINELNQGQGQLVSVSLLALTGKEDPYNLPPLEVKNITVAQLSQVQLVYFYTPKSDFLIPGYLFSGNGTTDSRKTVALTFFIPALPSQYLSE